MIRDAPSTAWNASSPTPQQEKQSLTQLLEANAAVAEQRGATRGDEKEAQRLKEKLKAVEGKYKQLRVEQRQKENALKMVKRDSARVQQLEASITQVRHRGGFRRG